MRSLAILRKLLPKKDWMLEKRVLSIQIDITNACNLRCSHCYHPDHNNSGAITLDEWKKILVQYSELLKTLDRRPSIIICGGEPTTSALLIPLLLWIQEKFGSVPLTLLTNGTFLSQRLLDALKLHEPYVQISIDGPNARSHDSVRGQGSFNKSVENIRIYKEAGIPVYLLGILSERTSKEIEAFFRSAKLLSVERMKFTRFVPEGHGINLLEKHNDRPLQPLELKVAYEKILEFSRKYKVATNSNKALFNLLDERIGEHEQFGFNGVVVDYKGNMKVSSRLPIVLGKITKTNTVKDIFLNHELLRNLRDRSKHECGSCPLFRRCGGSKNAAWAQYRDLFRKDPGCWINENSFLRTESNLRRSV